ncbi:hypothetical protein HGA64_05090 [Candidatus Falkowbacteria bacterium]|nr:hypothetical protein [Candidatus Falkowbacteria bacterium]
MPTPDPKYLPKAKKKKKPAKVHQPGKEASFPVPTKRPDARPSKKASPFGDKHVWAN